MWRTSSRAFRNGASFTTAVAAHSSAIKIVDPFQVLSLPNSATRDELRNQFFELAKSNHPAVGGDKEKFQAIKDAYEDAIHIVDQKHPIAPWDGISPMTYAQAWQGKDYWRRIWEEHWAQRLAHMYKHNDELTSLEATKKWREAQYVQVKDWMVLAKDLLDPKMKAEWQAGCELARDMLLWTQTNKKNYRRYFLSNQNVAVNMRQVYDEHEYWRHYESVQWAQWDAFFAKASAWAMEHEEQIRSVNSMEGPLATKFDYLFQGRLQYASLSLEEKMLQRAQEEKAYTRKYWIAELMKAMRFSMRWGERFTRAFFPVLLLVVVAGYITDFQLIVRWLNITRSETGALEVHNRKMDMVDWLLAGAPKPENIQGTI
eukprot:GGOE01065331.1.p1 GENE.GGOE01065331.1~~GGOE01065331.1.p1  ORF type:complete len:372 (-),score=90.29 GGOE01065331.1:138-1253(-)